MDFVEDNKGEPIPPKIQGVRVIVDAMKGIFPPSLSVRV